MTRGTRKTRRLGTRPRMCPPLKQASFSDPGYVLEPGLFLGLFDVTHRPAVAASPWLQRWDGIWHCFDIYPWFYYPGWEVQHSVEQVQNSVKHGYLVTPV